MSRSPFFDQSRTPPAAFSLVEVIVALSLGAVVMTAAFGIFVQARYTSVSAAMRAQLARDAQLALDVMERDFRAVGAGIPSGTCGDASCTSGSSLRPSIRRALSTNLVFLGDAPYPNAEVSGTAMITRIGADVDSTDVAVQSEISGTCTPYLASASPAYQCSTAAKTLLIGTFAATDKCNSGATTARTCPWALRKWQAPSSGYVNLVAIAPGGGFYTRRWNGSTFATVGNYSGIRVVAGSLGGAATLPRNTMFSAMGGGAFVSVDRVFYALENKGATTECNTTDCELKRLQCWGEVKDPGAAGFPASNTTFFGSSSTVDECTASGSGTGWETLLTGIESFAFSYQQDSADLTLPVATTSLANIRSINVTFTLKKVTPGSGPTLRHSVSQRFFLENRDTT